MSKNLEIEYKTLLTEQNYQDLLTHFNFIKDEQFTQVNHYFDTDKLELKSRGMGLRVRTLESRAELTLKVPQPFGLLETTDNLTLEEATQVIEQEQIPDGFVKDELLKFHLKPEKLKRIGCLKTTRAEKEISEGLLAIDESWYGNKHDYELELEVKNPQTGEENFNKLLASLGIKKISSKNKVARMMEESKNK
ncbi:MAG: CYTH domain-containing protein [Lactobacillales bacterium]|nr:CYTH domain-containing protein [Lactobacillales bacterium]